MPAPRSLPLAAFAALALMAPGTAAAQSSLIGVSATISTTALTIAQQADLDFGAVVPGVPVTINPQTSANPGAYVITGNKNSEIAVTMTLPTQLTTGVWTMPISFGATSGCWRQRTPKAGCTQYDPNNTLVARIRNSNPPNNTFHVWIGATVSPSGTQHTGMYLGTITASVVYTGN